jgi:hypothetical protein
MTLNFVDTTGLAHGWLLWFLEWVKGAGQVGLRYRVIAAGPREGGKGRWTERGT